MKKVHPTSLLQQRRRFLVRGAALTLATATCTLPMIGSSAPALAPEQEAMDLTAMVRSGQPVPVELFFASPENFSHFLALTGVA